MTLWQECRTVVEQRQKIGLLFRIRGLFRYGISNQSFYKQDIAKVITILQSMYYRAKEAELAQRISEIETYLIYLIEISRKGRINASNHISCWYGKTIKGTD